MTLYSSVFASPSRVQLARESGLDCTSVACQHAAGQHAAGQHASVATLAKAHELGMPYTEATIAVAALYNKLAEVQYLHSQRCPWAAGLLDRAASAGLLELLRWCYEHGCPWSEAVKAPVNAAESGNVDFCSSEAY
jgi:hypothetical protein